MGLRLPLTPYCVARGRGTCKTRQGSAHNDRIAVLLQRFESYLSRKDVKINAKNIIYGSVKRRNGKWFCESVFDADDTRHRKLKSLVKEVGRDGTIVVPDMTHVVGRKKSCAGADLKKLIADIVANNIEILPLKLKLKDANYDLTRIVNADKPDPLIFELIPEIANKTNVYLERVLADLNKMPKRARPARKIL
jgi:hypothetical protein